MKTYMHIREVGGCSYCRSDGKAWPRGDDMCRDCAYYEEYKAARRTTAEARRERELEAAAALAASLCASV